MSYFKTYYRQAKILKIFGLILSTVSIALLVIISIKRSEIIEVQNAKLDSINPKIDSINKFAIREFLIKAVVIQYLQSSKESENETLFNVYADTLRKFYLKQNISKTEAIRLSIQHQRSNLNERFNYKANEISIFPSQDGEVKVVVPGEYYQDIQNSNPVNILATLVFNKENKITSVSNYLDVEKK